MDELCETSGSIVAFGRRGGSDVVLKVVKHDGDEWRAGAVVDAFAGRGVVRVHEHDGGDPRLVLAERPARLLPPDVER